MGFSEESYHSESSPLNIVLHVSNRPLRYGFKERLLLCLHSLQEKRLCMYLFSACLYVLIWCKKGLDFSQVMPGDFGYTDSQASALMLGCWVFEKHFTKLKLQIAVLDG